MVRDEFKRYMDLQIVEIQKYKAERSKNETNFDGNKCVFEWIKKNAKTFRENWLK